MLRGADPSSRSTGETSATILSEVAERSRFGNPFPFLRSQRQFGFSDRFFRFGLDTDVGILRTASGF